MAIGGFWHGASWNFVVWGLWHGGLLALHRLWSSTASVRAVTAPADDGPGDRRGGDRRDTFPAPLPGGQDRRAGGDRRRPERRMPWIAGHVLTLLAVMIGWVVFRAPDLATAFGVYAGMLGLHGAGLSDELAWHLTPDRSWTLLVAACFVYLPLALGALRRAGWLPAVTDAGLPGVLARGWWLAWPLAAFLLAMVLLYSRSAVPFLYFQF